MQVHFSFTVTIFVALLFISGTVGCRINNDGPWYNPKTYAFTNPFAKKESEAPPFTAGTNKPSLGALPDIDVAPGGYTDGSFAHRTGSSGGTTVSTTPPAHWGQQNPVTPQGQSHPFGGYTVAEPSQYNPYDIAPSSSLHSGQSVTPHSPFPQQSQYHYQPEAMYQAGDPMYNYMQTSAHIPQQPMNHNQGSIYGAGQSLHSTPMGTMHPNDPNTHFQQQMQQPMTAQQTPMGFGHEQQAQNMGFSHEQQQQFPATQHQDGTWGVQQYQQQMYHPPAGGGFGY
jgi:hypothetical protein